MAKLQQKRFCQNSVIFQRGVIKGSEHEKLAIRHLRSFSLQEVAKTFEKINAAHKKFMFLRFKLSFCNLSSC